MEKRKTLKSIEVLLQQNAMQVAWDRSIIDDDGVTVLSSIIERCAYDNTQKDRFMFDLGSDSEPYINLIQWDK
jgi:hypothetical protein